MTIPKRIIQTHRSQDIGAAQRESWRTHHPDFDYQFFDDAACLRFMEKHFPTLLATYCKLPLPVQQADLFRYAAIYHGGGVYADVDTVCLAPLPSYVDMDASRLVVGLEMTPDDWPRGVAHYVQNYCSPMQVLQWVFAAPPRHPVLGRILERIRFLVGQCRPEQLARWSSASRFTLELTGPMLFTQVLLELAAQPGGSHAVVLQRAVWGALPSESRQPDVRAQMKVAHLFSGSWKPEWQAERA